MSRKAGLDYHVLEGREDACPVARGDFDEDYLVPDGNLSPSAWFDLKCDVQGIPFSTAHSELDTKIGGIPCTKDGPCQAMSQWIPIFEDRDEQFDVIHVTDTFAYNAHLIENTNVIYDEQPTYTKSIPKENTGTRAGQKISQRQIQVGITEFLQKCLPETGHNTWEGLITMVRNGSSSYRENVMSYLEDIDFDPSWYLDSTLVHTSVPVLVKAILNAEDVGNGRYRGQSTISDDTWYDDEDDQEPTERQVTVVFDDKNNIKLIHEPPDLSGARCVIGLDAHPTERLWKANTVSDLHFDDLGLSPDQLREWRRKERQLTVYQVGEATRSYTRGWAGDTAEARDRTQGRAEALIRAVRRKHGDEFRTAITAKSVRSDVEQLMRDAGIEDPEVLHYGNLKSLNRFDSEPVGLLVGSIDPGDQNIKDTLALLGLQATSEMMETEDGDEVRKPGRGFTGPDADAATEILASVRENNVAQAIGRYARDPNQSGSHATVYVWTDAIPESLSDGIVPGVTDVLTGKRQKISNFVARSGEWLTCREIVEIMVDDGLVSSVTKEHVHNTLKGLVERDAAKISKGTGKYGGDEFQIEPDTVTDLVELEIT
jgi:hypothetical protein